MSGPVLNEWTPHIRTVPHETVHGACRVCLGAGGDFPTCFKCGQVWVAHPEFDGCCDLIVPCTVAVSPGPWYTAMLQYKWKRKWATYAPALAAVLKRWLDAHWTDLAAGLGGDPTLVCVVPSRSIPMPTPLARVVNAVPRLTDLLVPAVQFSANEQLPPWKQKSLQPDAFEVTADVAGERILLVEDTWVTGSTPLSAAIKLRRQDPASLGLLVIARMVHEDFMTPQYNAAASAPIDFATYPRG